MTDAGQQPLMSQRGALPKLLQVSIAPETSGGSFPRAVMTTLWPTSPTIPSAALHSIDRLSVATWRRSITAFQSLKTIEICGYFRADFDA
jgi:hypothetical protein